MSSAYVKGRLKAARAALEARDWSTAASTASDILSFEASNANALIFKALALSNLNQLDESEALYRRALEEHPGLALAEKGLLKLFEDSRQWDKLQSLVEQLMREARDKDDAMKVAEYLQKLLALKREHGSPADIASTLELLLPGSPYHELLSTLPDPEPTKPLPVHSIQLLMQNSLPALEEIISIVEHREAAAIAQETDRRRMRLTGKVQTAEETLRSVQSDLMGSSGLPKLYTQVLSHPYASDTLRRFTEAKLLFHFYSYLISIPPFLDEDASPLNLPQDTKEIQTKRKQKKKLKERTLALASDMVLLKVPDRLAWSIKLNWTDVDGPSSYDLYDLRKLAEIFPPEEPLAKLAQVLTHDSTPPQEEQSAEKAQAINKSALVQQALEALPDSLFAHVVAAQQLLDIKDYAGLRTTCESALQALKQAEQHIGERLPRVQTYLNCYLAAAYVHVDPPIHHRKALRLLDLVLQADASNQLALLSKGYILSAAESWTDALAIFDQLLSAGKTSESTNLEARGERAWCLVGLGKLEEAESELEAVLDILYQQSIEDEELNESLKEAKGRTWWRLGRCYWARGGDHREVPEFAYTSFTESIRICPTFSPSFTWLGKYYLQISNDREQAIRLFQKALDLDANEHEAGQLLAELFAQSEEWSAVELVARRIVSVLAASSTTETALSGTLILKRYAWAWRAIGMADIKSSRFDAALLALQRTLRGELDDATAWLQLGIAYRGSGKHIAALKAFGRVIELAPDTWAAYYLAGEIQRSIGLLEAAVANFKKVLELRPGDLGLQVVLAETLLLQGRVHLQNGLLDRAIDTLLNTLRSALAIIDGKTGAAAASKILADGLSDLVSLALPTDDRAEELAQVLNRSAELFVAENLDQHLPAVVPGFSSAFDMTPLSLQQKLAFSFVLSCKLKLLYEPPDSAAQASAWADLGIAVSQQRSTLQSLRPEYTDDEILRWSVSCLRSALKAEPRNPVFWNALGVISFDLSPRLAQHSFIRSAEYNQRSAIPWTHLGVFYLHHGQVELANKAFLKAQVLDPEWPNAWLGQACLAALHSDERERRALVAHAWMLAAGSVPFADLEYAKLALCEPLPHHAQPSNASAAQSIRRYLNHAAGDMDAQYLSGILSERLQANSTASDAFSKAADMYEAKYELSESETDARSFTLAKLGQGRALLAAGQPVQAIEALEVALRLLSEPAADEVQLKIETLMHLGLAQWRSKRADAGLASLEAATELAESSQLSAWVWRVALVMARCLWTSGTQESKASANDLLLSCINDPSTALPNLEVITTLAAFAILDKDDDMLEAAVSEIQELSCSNELQVHEAREQMKDMMSLYSGLVERCFATCSTDFSSKSLSSKEEDCVGKCADKFLNLSNRVGLRFSEYNADQMAKQGLS